MPRRSTSAPTRDSTIASGSVSTTTKPSSMPSGIAQNVSGANRAATPTERTVAVTRNATAPSGKLQQEEDEVLPRGRVGQARPEPAPDRRVRRNGSVGVGDHPPGEGRDQPPLELGDPARGIDRSDQDGDADEGDRQPGAEGDRGDEEGELGQAQRQREQQVGDPPVGARIQDLPVEPLAHAREG